MTDCVSFIQKNGDFTIEFENGQIKRGSAEQSFALHNLLCFQRLDKELIPKGGKGLGWSGSVAYNKEFFSKAWSYYIEDNFSQIGIKGMINEFNRAYDRDYKAGLVQTKLRINKVYKLDKTTMLVNLMTDTGETDIAITL